nr:hypothetical protein [Paenibacillus shirakamiensis]
MIISVALIGGIGTFIIGQSKDNKTSNPNYEKRSLGNISRLSWIYLVVTVVSVGTAALYMLSV